MLETEKRAYERITFLQGISHDLKIPLSIIKLNTQMIENYPLEKRETVKLATTSLESISDLERMVEQINFYINAENITTKSNIDIDESTSRDPMQSL